MAKRRIAIYGGSFNCAGNHHLPVARLAAERFGEVIVLPCGGRPDKPTTGDIDPSHRAVMTDLAFRGIPNVRVDLSDLERDSFTRTIDVEARFRGPDVEVWHVLGSDLFVGGRKGTSVIQRKWYRGREVWKTLRFAIVIHPDHPFSEADLPPNAVVIGKGIPGSSTRIRALCHERKWEEMRALVPAAVADYVERWQLYTGRGDMLAGTFAPDAMRPQLVVDRRNPKAVAIAAALREKFGRVRDPNCLAVIGGDGAFMRALRQHWQRRLPFVGINAGHRGFLLNRRGNRPLARRDLVIRRMSFLHVAVTPEGGGPAQEHLAVNDAWLRNAAGQTAWIKLVVNGRPRIEKLTADGLLVSSVLGSTAYAYQLGAEPLYDRQGLVVAGIVPDRRLNWRWTAEPLDARVEMQALDTGKRPVEAFVDSVPMGRATNLKVRSSRIATAEILFTPEDDLARKHDASKYPSL